MVELYGLFIIRFPATQPKIGYLDPERTLCLPVHLYALSLFARSPNQCPYRGKYLCHAAAQRHQKSALDTEVRYQFHYLQPTGVSNSPSVGPKLEFGV